MSSKASHLVDGFLLIDKPAGIRSTECVSAVKRALGRGSKVGHAGTLDSTAKGLLVVLVGKATRLCRYVMDLPKFYEGTVVLGVTTSTDDDAGDVLMERKPQDISIDDLSHLIPSFLGVRMQRPPSISAIRVDGKRAHAISRENSEPLRLSPRPIFISNLAIGEPSGDPLQVSIKVLCHKGTYIRSIARDIGDALGCGAHLKGLSRKSIGPFEQAMGISINSDLSFEVRNLSSSIVPIQFLEHFYATYLISSSMVERLRNGLDIPVVGLDVISRSVSGGGKSVIAKGEGLFSFCRLKISEGKGVLVPETNLFLSGGELFDNSSRCF